ncbi:MAG TPA: RNA polymerase sigma factor [Ignavibacteriaceae bacterium]|jgi:RNA polymerase sigma-70 factor (ECF subfamily)|nr:RNA polymerase sigma factor [Ignavibacteriaceae bacterium]
MDKDDKDLVKESLQGSQKSFEEIVDRYYKTIYRLAYRILHDDDNAEEITQIVFVKAYESLGSFNPKFKFFSWLYRIAVNETLNLSKKLSYTEKLNEEYSSAAENPDEIYARSELGEKIEIALMELDILYRVPLVFKHFMDYSYKEISELLGVPEKTIKSRLFTGRQILKEVLIKNKIFQK